MQSLGSPGFRLRRSGYHGRPSPDPRPKMPSRSLIDPTRDTLQRAQESSYKLLHAATGTRDTSRLLKEGKLRHTSAVRPHSGWRHALATFSWSKRGEPSPCSTSHPCRTLLPACPPRDAVARRSSTQLRVLTPTLQRPSVPRALSLQLL